jgi:glycosyltransferase involved in cell wall biosynthesis
MVSDHADHEAGVHLFNGPDDGQLAGMYRRAWVFCLPSSYEGLGLPYLEAMAAGVPVVTTANFGAMRIVTDTAGKIVPAPELGHALVELLTNPAERERLAEAGRRRAAGFSWDAAVKQHEAAYRLAAERWRHARSRSTSPLRSLRRGTT